MRVKIGKLTVVLWLIVVYLAAQLWIMFVYDKKKGTPRDLAGLELMDRAGKSENLFFNFEGKNCSIPDDWLYPLCKYKVEWMRSSWQVDKDCYVRRNRINPADDCSLLIFFSEVESWCPVLSWRKHLFHPNENRQPQRRASVREDVGEILHQMSHEKYQWMRERITRLWPDWSQAAKHLERNKPAFKERLVKNIFVYMGVYSQHKWLENAYSGAPLGEMVQWSDLIASLYVLGHNVTVTTDRNEMKRFLGANADHRACARRLPQKAFDLIFVDYIGRLFISFALGAMRQHYRCNYRILDSFGTEAEFNFAEYAFNDQKTKSQWGGADVHLRQIMTMFPHSPDNLFLGFVVDKAVAVETRTSNETLSVQKPIGLLYGKKAGYLRGRRKYIDVLSKYLEIHATMSNTTQIDQTLIPDYVVNHGILKGDDLQKLLRKTKVFIGLGFPYEGPAPLEAISQGCVFLNPKFEPPLSSSNSDFFKGKPTSRKVTSQNPYMEIFVGEPHVYTINIDNLETVESTLKKIMSSQVKPYLPYEWTPEGMLERLNSFIEHLDFCEHKQQWPPLKEMHLMLAPKGNSCTTACAKNGLLCEPSFFKHINTAERFKTFGVHCEKSVKSENLHAPSYNPDNRSCTFQAISLLFSCVSTDEAHMRLCPCRDYQSGQVAICQNCD
ncbi:alpha-1,6-mannosylglycoprotein 6-beta-N-acetylglucosaminyltransferase A-like isoform X1 [Acropora millepora]|uniref:alpha-1,6-mannosylglycoprotein 6-beta-N-acetylglucosaminyltransferase A-like isoform X1 n=2 Tax=Acropora millepora TaxID=45264 RepID=UPI001CF276D2|nr:alpha-1,6-mannosylglycoprotein 6-beta-N-acetylglucosaminyltransferase A-like isoform X1 [Acropora millepora]